MDLRIGMVGLDTSHCPAFANLLNNPKDPNHVAGGQLTIAFPGGSQAFAPSRDRVGKFTAQMRDEFKVAMADSIAAVAEQSDAIMLESVDGRQHLEQFQQLAPFGKPVFIDKPFATSLADAQQIAALAEQHKAPVYSCSSIRYAAGIAELGADAKVLGCHAFGPMSILEDFPGLFWYGIHSAEVLFSKLGAGCRTVAVRKTDSADIVTGVWADGRLGVLQGYRIPNVGAFGCTVFTEKGVAQSLALPEPPYYLLLMRRIMEFFQTGRAPIDIRETLEITAFLEAANRSRVTGAAIQLQL